MGSNKLYRLDEYVKLMEECIGRKAKCNYKEFHKADVKATWTDIEKAKKLLDWRSQVSLEEGIKRTVQWTQENWEWVKNIKIS